MVRTLEGNEEDDRQVDVDDGIKSYERNHGNPLHTNDALPIPIHACYTAVSVVNNRDPCDLLTGTLTR